MSQVQANSKQQSRADGLITFMLAMYGEKFKTQYKGQRASDLAAIWEPMLANLTDQQLQHGIEVCKTKPWPPTFPEFLSFCVIDLDYEALYHEAVIGLTERDKGLMGYWSQPAVYHAAATMASDILSNAYHFKKKQWQVALDAAVRDKSNEPIPEPTLRIESRSSAPASAAQARDIMGLVAGSVNKSKSSREWAKKILENPKGKSMATIRIARNVVNGGGNDSDD